MVEFLPHVIKSAKSDDANQKYFSHILSVHTIYSSHTHTYCVGENPIYD